MLELLIRSRGTGADQREVRVVCVVAKGGQPSCGWRMLVELVTRLAWLTARSWSSAAKLRESVENANVAVGETRAPARLNQAARGTRMWGG